MSVFVTTEQAKEFAAKELENEEGVPRRVDFTHSANHLASAILFAAMGDAGQVHDIGKLHTAFRVRSPSITDKGSDKHATREHAKRLFDKYCEQAQERIVEKPGTDILDALQFASANMWRYDNEPIMIYAVDSAGTAARVSQMGGWVDLDNSNWPLIASLIESGIQREF